MVARCLQSVRGQAQALCGVQVGAQASHKEEDELQPGQTTCMLGWLRGSITMPSRAHMLWKRERAAVKHKQTVGAGQEQHDIECNAHNPCLRRALVSSTV